MSTVGYWLVLFVVVAVAWLLIVQPALSRLVKQRWDNRRG